MRRALFRRAVRGVVLAQLLALGAVAASWGLWAAPAFGILWVPGIILGTMASAAQACLAAFYFDLACRA